MNYWLTNTTQRNVNCNPLSYIKAEMFELLQQAYKADRCHNDRYWTPCLSGYACLIPGVKKIPFSRILGRTTPPILAKTRSFLLLQQYLFSDFKEWILEGKI